MAASNWQRWYREGTVNVTNNSKTITGTGTYWSSASIKAGDVFSLDGVTDYEVATVNNDTTITLATVYTGKTAAGQEYHIHRAFSATTGAEVAAQTAALVQDMARYVDSEHATIQGKSAYEIAKDNGFVGTAEAWLNSLVGKSAYEVAVAGGYKGTQAEWLESLKAAGEWSALDARTKILGETFGGVSLGNIRIHNSFYRGKNLGTHPTEAQYRAIRTGVFTDMWLGDYWQDGYNRWSIVGFDPGYWWGTSKGTDPLTGETRMPLHGGTNDTGTWFSYRGHHITLAVSPGTIGPLHDDPAVFYYKNDEDKNEDNTWVGYTNCHWYRTVRPKLLSSAQQVFGDEHLYEWIEPVPTGYNAEGEPTGWRVVYMRCELPTFRMWSGQPLVMPYGTKAGQIAPHPMTNDYWDGRQWPLGESTGIINCLCSGIPWWTRDVYGLDAAKLGLVGHAVGNVGYPLTQPYALRWSKMHTTALIMVGSEDEAGDSTITIPEGGE